METRMGKMMKMGSIAEANGPPASPIAAATNSMVTPLLTDQYQFTMAYAYWKAGKHQERAVCVFFPLDSTY
ncbi:hypothetical protein KSP39_PZI003564 [Platanthera zijinensis]|uniref:Uncharacterized protein n=1 Tax=Platanthera zijinensis TaxID=2320716 RepID=A0AAP0BTP9_9ASPA